MNSYPWQLASWTDRIEDHKPFYLAVIDGETRLGFVNSHFHLRFQQADHPTQPSMLRCLIDDRDRRRFDNAVTSCLAEEKTVRLEVRMHVATEGSSTTDNETWIRWELRFLEAIGDGPGRLFCLGYSTSGPETADAATDTGDIIHDLHQRLIHQKETIYKKVREATIRGEQLERERIGHELHDNICQILSSAQLFLSCLTPDNLSHNITPPDLLEKGLIEPINRLVEDIRCTGHLNIDFISTDRATLETQDPDLKQTVFRILQEQMQNIGKYSKASNVRITLQAIDEQLRLQITDNGIGFDPKTVRHGLGIDGIHRRAQLFNGKAIFKSAPGKGCSLLVTIPLQLKRIF